jgi:putative NADPH-quinone reductase
LAKQIAVIQGHPDPRGNRFAHALVQAYVAGAKAAGHEVRVIDVARLDFPLLRTKEDYEGGMPPDSIRQAQESIRWAEHLVILFPLWAGTLPALLKAFLEQVFRPGFAFAYPDAGGMPKRLLTGKTARVIVTMGMPAFVFRWYFGAHGLKSLKRSILGFSGIGPIKDSLIGTIEAADNSVREKWLVKMRALGGEAI